MIPETNPNWFAASPLERLNIEVDNEAFLDEKLNAETSLLIPLWRGDPLIVNNQAAFLSATARSEFPAGARIVYLGALKGAAYFGIDASSASETPDAAPFADLGEYMPIRMAASAVSRDDIAIIGHARWLLEWHRKHGFCAVCGTATDMASGGAKRQCPSCQTEHFPRTDPVAIVLAVHDDACLLGRGPEWPAGMVSALAGYIEPAETPEEAAKRELFEEAGVTLTDVRYQFSQPWPFPTTLMMGFIADAADRTLTLDEREIAEAHWVPKTEIQAMLAGEPREDLVLPPKFTIARQLVERWVQK